MSEEETKTEEETPKATEDDATDDESGEGADVAAEETKEE